MKRILLFVLTNLAVMVVLGVVASLLGVNRYLTANGMNLSALLGYALIMGFGGAFISLLMSKPMAKWSAGVQIIEQPRNQDEAWIVDTVRKFADKAGIGMPEVGIFEGDPNAFATGAFRDSALVAVSTGLLYSMNKEEVEAVIGHEVAHIANGDMVTMTLIQGVMNTFVVFLSRVVGYAVDSFLRKNDEENTGPGIGYFVTTIVLDIVLGFLAAIIVAWFSRQREFRADAGSAELLGDRRPMMRALARLGRLPVLQNDGGREKWGRDHNTHGFSMWLAGGGFKGGHVHGETDEFGHHAALLDAVVDGVAVHEVECLRERGLHLDLAGANGFALCTTEGGEEVVRHRTIGDLNGVGLEETASMMITKPQIKTFDAADFDSCRALVAAAATDGLDVLCNISGMLKWGPTLEFSEEDFARILTVNTTSTFVMCKAALPHLLERQALDHPEGLFTPQTVGHGRGLPVASQRLGRLPGAHQVTGQQGAWRHRGQMRAQTLCLAHAQAIEGRIQVPLKPQFAVPVGFTVSHQPEINHGAIIRGAHDEAVSRFRMAW